MLTPAEKEKLVALRQAREEAARQTNLDKVNERSRRLRADPVYRAIENEKSKLAMRRRRQDPEYRALERARAMLRKEPRA